MNNNGKCCNNEPVNTCDGKNSFNAVILIVLYILLAIIIGSWLVY